MIHAIPRAVIRTVAVLLLTLATSVGLLGLAGPAAAHTELITSTPAVGERLPTAPPAVTLTFDEVIDPRFATVVITGPAGALPTSAPARVDGVNVSQLFEGPPTPGDYVITYRVVSGDGHPVEGEIAFGIEPPPPPPPAPSPEPTATPAETTAPAPVESAPVAAPGISTESVAGGSGDISESSGSGTAVGLGLGAAAVVALVAGGALVARRRGEAAPPGGAAAPDA